MVGDKACGGGEGPGHLQGTFGFCAAASATPTGEEHPGIGSGGDGDYEIAVKVGVAQRAAIGGSRVISDRQRWVVVCDTRGRKNQGKRDLTRDGEFATITAE